MYHCEYASFTLRRFSRVITSLDEREAMGLNKENLIEEAIKARERAYVPYSRFPVGAAVVTTDGNVYTGCNIENAAFPVSCCAERVALFSAIANGEKTFKAM